MEWTDSKATNQPVLLNEGKYISSFYNPNKEAQAWIQSIKKYILKKENIVILGCGSGYQISGLDLLGFFKKIYVICLDSTQKKLIQSEFNFSESVILYSSGEVESNNLQDLKNKSFGVFEIKTDKSINPKKYNSLRELINQRSNISNFNNKDFIKLSNPEKNELMSVKHIRYKKNKSVDLIIQELVR